MTPDAFLSRYFWILLPLFWLVLCRFAAAMSGWRNLAGSYAAQSDFTGPVMRFRSGSFRWSTNYSGILNVGADRLGVSLSVPAVFRPGHAALFVPHGDIRVEKHGAFGQALKLTFVRCPHVPLFISRSLGEKIADRSGGAFPLPRAES